MPFICSFFFFGALSRVIVFLYSHLVRYSSGFLSYITFPSFLGAFNSHPVGEMFGSLIFLVLFLAIMDVLSHLCSVLLLVAMLVD